MSSAPCKQQFGVHFAHVKMQENYQGLNMPSIKLEATNHEEWLVNASRRALAIACLTYSGKE